MNILEYEIGAKAAIHRGVSLCLSCLNSPHRGGDCSNEPDKRTGKVRSSVGNRKKNQRVLGCKGYKKDH